MFPHEQLQKYLTIKLQNFSFILFHINRFSELAMAATVDPISQNKFLHRFTKLHREEKKVLKILHDFVDKIIRDRRIELNEGKASDEWLPLNYYIQNKVGPTFLTDEEIREEINTMIFGTHDTSKSTFAFLLYNLAKYPEIQQKAYEEIVLEVKDEIIQPELLQIPYTEAVIKETLRLFSPIPHLCRKLGSELTIGGYTFPKGAEMAISPYLMGRNPKYFKDPLTFNPDRFHGVDVAPEGFIPFSIGARKCIGGKIAIMSLKNTIAMFLKSFKIALPKDSEEMTVYAELSLKPLNGILLNIEKRQKKIK